MEIVINITMRESANAVNAIYAAIEQSNLLSGGPFNVQQYAASCENYIMADVAIKLQRLKYSSGRPKKITLLQIQVDAVHRRTGLFGQWSRIIDITNPPRISSK